MVGVPTCVKVQGDERGEEFEPCYRYAWEGLPTRAQPDERLERGMREREELVTMEAATPLRRGRVDENWHGHFG